MPLRTSYRVIKVTTKLSVAAAVAVGVRWCRVQSWHFSLSLLCALAAIVVDCSKGRGDDTKTPTVNIWKKWKKCKSYFDCRQTSLDGATYLYQGRGKRTHLKISSPKIWSKIQKGARLGDTKPSFPSFSSVWWGTLQGYFWTEIWCTVCTYVLWYVGSPMKSIFFSGNFSPALCMRSSIVYVL